MNVYIINKVCSEGFMTGNESYPFTSIEMDEVIRKAYFSDCGYKNTFESYSENELCNEDDEMQYEEFRSIMEQGFRSKNGNPYVNIDCINHHINFEPFIALL